MNSMRSRWLARCTTTMVLVLAACAPDAEGPPLVGAPITEVNSQRLGDPLGDAVDDLPFMRAAGCTEVTGLPPVGAIRFQGKNGRWRSYHCPGATKAAVRAAVGRFQEAKADRARRGSDGQVRLAAANGYFLLTVVSTEWCVQSTTHMYVNGQYYSTTVTIVPGSCFWVTTYSVEYIGGEMPQPWEDYCCSGPGTSDDPDPPPPPPPPPDSLALCSVQEHISRPQECLVALKPAERDFLRGLRDLHGQDPLSMSNLDARADCTMAFAWLDELFASQDTLIYKGKYDSGSPPSTGHIGTTATLPDGRRVVHIDPWYLTNASTDVARAALLRTLLHEAVHARAPQHAHPGYTADNPEYVGYPIFSTIESRDPAISCVIPVIPISP